VNLHVDIPEGAEERAWEVVRRAFAEREAVPRPRRYVRSALALAVALAIVAGALTGPGRAVLGDIRQAVGEKNAAPALFSLPAPGRLIVYSTDGPWIVDRDGSKRLLDRYDELSWSPHGKYVAATRRQELFAIEPNGDVHWSLARTGRISVPTWGGTRDDTRIAYLGAGPNLRVVGGDGKGDRLLARNVARATPAWLPAAGRHLLAFADRLGGIHLVDVDRPAPLRPVPGGEVPEELQWVGDGSALLVLSPRSLRILRPDRSLVRRIALPPGPHSLAVSPHGHLFALTRRFGPDRSEVLVFAAAHPLKARRLFAATGTFTGVEWSPDGRWLLLAWPDADQWLFVGTGRERKVLPVARVAEQFSQSGVFPALGGWCCAP
jgi:WD40 repeat protein